MSSKKKSSRLRLRSQTNVNSRIQNTAVISHYFKKPSSESYEVPSTCEKSPNGDDNRDKLSSFGIKNIPNDVKVNTRTKCLETQKLLNLSDDLSDFSTPKPIKRVVPKIFEPKFKPKPVPKRNKKSNKKITEESRKFLYDSKDYNQEHLHLAIALSKSVQDFENPGESSQSSNYAENELTPTQENVLKIRRKLTKFQFKNKDPFESKNENNLVKAGKSKKVRNHPFMSTLIRRTYEDRENIIQRKVSNILNIENVQINCEKRFYSDLKICDSLEKYYCDEKTLFKKAELLETEKFYTNQLVTPTTAKCGSLLRDWSKILGREITPPREIKIPIEKTNFHEKLKIPQLKIQEENMEISKKLEISNVEKSSKILSDSSKSEFSTSIVENIEDSKLTIVEHKSEILEISQHDIATSCVELPQIRIDSNQYELPTSKSSQDSIDPNEKLIPVLDKKNITIRSLTPDLFSDSEDEIFLEKSINATFTIEDNNTNKISVNEEDILDLTQSTNSEKNVSQTFEKHSDHDSDDNSNNSDDSLFDLPEFDIKYTINKSKNDEIKSYSQNFKQLDREAVDLSQTSNSNDNESQECFEAEILKKNRCSFLNENLTTENRLIEDTSSKSQLNKNLNQSVFENDENGELIVDLSQSSNSCDGNNINETEFPKKIQFSDGYSSKNVSIENLADESQISEKSISNMNLHQSKFDFSMNFENDREMLVDLSQSSDDGIVDTSEIPKKIQFSDRNSYKNVSNENLADESQISEKSISKTKLLQSKFDFSMNFKNDREMIVDLSQSSDDGIVETSETSKKIQFFSGNSPKNISNESKITETSLSPNKNLNESNFNLNIDFENDDEMHVENQSEMSTPKSRLNISNLKLKRKSKSFSNENLKQSNTTLKKFNSFMENFDYELETSTHISLNANKLNILDSDISNSNSQSESDDSLIIISDDELNYSCSTPYRKIKSEKTSSSSSSISESPSKFPVEETDFSIHKTDKILSFINESPMKSLEETFMTKSSKSTISKYSIELKETDFPNTKTTNLSGNEESPLKSPIELKKTDLMSPKKTELSTNISILLGDSFERELRRTTSLWDRVCGKKQIEISKSKTPQIHKKNTFKTLETPRTQMEIKTHDITPMPNYDGMETPGIRQELQKYGLKSLKRRRAAQILKYIYEQTHPFDDDESGVGVETYSDTEDLGDHRRLVKRSKRASTTKLDNFIPVSPSKIEIVGDLLPKNWPESDLVFETRQSSKIASCRLPFHIAWHNYLSENPELRLKILKYFPVQLEDICVHFKEMGFKYHANDILSFLDKKCITIRTNQNSQRNKKSTAKNNKGKRY